MGKPDATAETPKPDYDPYQETRRTLSDSELKLRVQLKDDWRPVKTMAAHAQVAAALLAYRQDIDRRLEERV